MKLEASTRLQASADEDVISTTAIAYERKQPSGKWAPRHVVVPSKDAAAKMKSLKADPKVRNPKMVSASTRLECGCVSAKVCAHSVSALTEKQKQLDIDGDGKIDGEDLKKVREGELATSTAKSTNPPKETTMEAKARLTASTQTQITAAKTAQVKFKDGSVHKVSFFSDPTKRRGTFILKSPDLPSLKFMLEGGKYVVYTVGNTRNDIDKDSRFDTKTAEAADAYAKGIKKFWKAL